MRPDILNGFASIIDITMSASFTNLLNRFLLLISVKFKILMSKQSTPLFSKAIIALAHSLRIVPLPINNTFAFGLKTLVGNLKYAGRYLAGLLYIELKISCTSSFVAA